MALHRDILWIGKQWAVTGHGMQLIDQRLMGAFDIEAARLWDHDLIERMHAKDWLNAADFDKGLEVARVRHLKPAGPTPVAAPAPAMGPIAPPKAAEPQPPESPSPVAVEPLKQESPDIQMKIDGQARFVRPWRVWMKRRT
jgi:hypothetical protein